jgi:hypothetical protein
MIRRHRVLKGVLCIAVFAFITTPALAKIGDIKSHFELPNQGTYTAYTFGLGTSGNHLYVAVQYYDGSEYVNKIWAVDKSSHEVKWGFDIQDYGRGTACDEGSVWVSEDTRGTMVQYTPGGSVIKIWGLQGGHGYTSGLAYGGNDNLFVSTSSPTWLLKYRRDGLPLKWWRTHNDYKELAWDGSYLWALTWPAGLCKVNPKNAARLWYVRFNPATDITSPTGLAHDGTDFWVAGRYKNTSKSHIFKVDAGDVAVAPASLGSVKALFR